MAADRVRILATGDTVGEPGREACSVLIPRLIEEERLDFVVVNGENIAGGAGLTDTTAQELFKAGVDIITSGDHYFDRREAYDYLAHEPRILRPCNYPDQAPGNGTVIAESRSGKKIGVLNLLGQVFMHPHVQSPFHRAKEEVDRIRKDTPIIVIDMHAEATSEKIALGWYLDGKVSLIVGSHTHIQTSDECVLPQGTAYITDMGMCGPYKSVLGRDIHQVLNRFLTQVPARFPVAHEDIRLSGVIAEIDAATGKAVSIKRVHERLR
jgi:metallophosphoesterase (TIGR00282 family)